MLYAIIGHDVPDSLPLRRQLRPRHLEHLGALQAEGRLLMAGPFPAVDAPELSAGASGSLIVAEFLSLDAARAWAEADPYRSGGVFASVDVRPFLKALPA